MAERFAICFVIGFVLMGVLLMLFAPTFERLANWWWDLQDNWLDKRHARKQK